MTDDSTPPRKRVAAYCRYSSRAQDDGYSIERQQDMLSLEAIRRGDWDIEWFIEPAKSAFADEAGGTRPVWEELMRRVRNRDFDVVAVTDATRWSRRLHVGMRAIEEIARAGATYVELGDGGLDARSPTGFISTAVKGAFAQFDSMLKSEHVKGGLLQRAKRGLFVGSNTPPFGYRVQDRLDGARLPFEYDVRDNDPEGHPGNYAGLKQAFDLMLAGKTNQEIATILTRQGTWGPFAPSQVNNIRHNVYYRPYQAADDRGTVTLNGMEYRGLHPAACTWDEWQTMQEVATNRRRGWARTHHRRPEPFTAEFRAALSCTDCGSRLWVVRKSDHAVRAEGQDEQYVERYMCPAKQRGISCPSAGKYIYADEMRERWMEWLRAHPLPSDFEERVKQYVLWISKNQRKVAGVGDKETSLAKIIAERETLERKRVNVTAVYMSGRTEMREREWRREIDAIDKRLKQLNHVSRDAEQITIRFMQAARIMTDAASAWAVMTTAERQIAAQLMIEELGVRVKVEGEARRRHRYQASPPPSGHIVSVTLREPFRDLLAVVNGELVSQEVAG